MFLDSVQLDSAWKFHHISTAGWPVGIGRRPASRTGIVMYADLPPVTSILRLKPAGNLL